MRVKRQEEGATERSRAKANGVESLFVLTSKVHFGVIEENHTNVSAVVGINDSSYTAVVRVVPVVSS